MARVREMKLWGQWSFLLVLEEDNQYTQDKDDIAKMDQNKAT